MSDPESTIDFLIDKVKGLELDVQYELHRADEAQEKYNQLRNMVILKLQELLISLEKDL